MVNVGIFGKHDSVIVLMFLRIHAAARRRMLRQAGTLDEVTMGMVREAMR
jgi:hypothetical protein